MADGQTVEEAIHEAEAAIESWIKTAEEFNDEIPRPSIAQQFSGQWRIRVPKSLHAALALHAKEEGVSLNMLAATLLAQGIGKELTVSHKRGNMEGAANEFD
jgi:antitoxin HicB